MGIFNVRTSVKENHLSREEMEQMGITESVVIDMIEKVVAHGLLWMAEKRLFFRLFYLMKLDLGDGNQVSAARNLSRNYIIPL